VAFEQLGQPLHVPAGGASCEVGVARQRFRHVQRMHQTRERFANFSRSFRVQCQYVDHTDEEDT
jgi:hypothetical protein